MRTYRIVYRDGTTEEVNADWTEHRDGVVWFMRQRRTTSSAPWPRDEVDHGGMTVAKVDSASIELLEALEQREAV